jgi:hypothetical protein
LFIYISDQHGGEKQMYHNGQHHCHARRDTLFALVARSCPGAAGERAVLDQQILAQNLEVGPKQFN